MSGRESKQNPVSPTGDFLWHTVNGSLTLNPRPSVWAERELCVPVKAVLVLGPRGDEGGGMSGWVRGQTKDCIPPSPPREQRPYQNNARFCLQSF